MSDRPDSPRVASDWEAYNREDRGTAGVIVVTMTVIFLMGLGLYIAIAWVIAN